MIGFNVAKYILALCAILAGFYGFYLAGYESGQKNKKIEYIEKEKEVIRYVERKIIEKTKKIQKIQNRPNADYIGVVKWLRESGATDKH